MKRETRHPPCTYKLYRARARYTRVMKALSMLKDANASGSLERTLALHTELAFDMHRITSVRMWRTTNAEGRHLYLLEIKEQGKRLYGRKGDDIKSMLNDLRDEAMADEAAEIGRIWNQEDGA